MSVSAAIVSRTEIQKGARQVRIIKTKGRRGNGDFFWTVDGVASCGSIEAAVELAIEAQREIVKSATVRSLWTVYA
jgi:hypothetical protein